MALPYFNCVPFIRQQKHASRKERKERKEKQMQIRGILSQYLRHGGQMTDNEIAKEIVDAAFKIHSQIGPGLLESAYEALMVHELTKRGLRVVTQQPVVMNYEGIRIEVAFKADLIVEDKV